MNDILVLQDLVWICTEIKYFWNKIVQENEINALISWKLIQMKLIKNKGSFTTYYIDELSPYFTVFTML